MGKLRKRSADKKAMTIQMGASNSVSSQTIYKRDANLTHTCSPHIQLQNTKNIIVYYHIINIAYIS